MRSFGRWHGVREYKKTEMHEKGHSKRRGGSSGSGSSSSDGGSAQVLWAVSCFLCLNTFFFYLFRWRILPWSWGRRARSGCSGLGRPLLLRQERERKREKKQEIFVKLAVRRIRRIERTVGIFESELMTWHYSRCDLRAKYIFYLSGSISILLIAERKLSRIGLIWGL